MFNTKNDLSLNTRNEVISLLQNRLADSIDLLLQTKQAHWNVKGPHFLSLHELFDELHEDAEKYVDTIAERIAQLGGAPEGTSNSVVKSTSLPEYPLGIASGEKHVDSLSTALSSFGKLTRRSIEEVEGWKDAVTSDILIEITRSVDKNLWFVESHLMESKATEERAKGAA